MFDNPNEKYYRRGDSLKTPVEWHRFKSEYNYNVAYEYSGIRLVSNDDDDGCYHVGSEHYFDLLQLPEIGPWTCPQDMPPVCRIRRKSDKHIEEMLTAFDRNDLPMSANGSYTYSSLFINYEWNACHNDINGWKLCSKTSV